MSELVRIRRFSVVDRLFHFFLVLTFLTQCLTGMGRLLYTTNWGKWLVGLFGGYESADVIHNRVGVFMLLLFLAHIVYVLARVDWRSPLKSLFGPDSLIPNWQDFRNFGRQVRWFFGLGSPPAFDRWTYFEKFDYWAVFWGMPLLAATGLMLMYPVAASRLVPGWFLNIALLLHRAEALLAMLYIFIVHFIIGHLRRGMFPMNEAMFAGSVVVEKERHEKPGWIDRLRAEGRLAGLAAAGPPAWYRVLYFIFGYAALAVGLYLLFIIVAYSRYIEWH